MCRHEWRERYNSRSEVHRVRLPQSFCWHNVWMPASCLCVAMSLCASKKPVDVSACCVSLSACVWRPVFMFACGCPRWRNLSFVLRRAVSRTQVIDAENEAHVHTLLRAYLDDVEKGLTSALLLLLNSRLTCVMRHLSFIQLSVSCALRQAPEAWSIYHTSTLRRRLPLFKTLC